MCGIAGIRSYNGLLNKNRVMEMCKSLEHRGPDGQGIWLGSEKYICLGHRRLSILDLSTNGAQPMISEDDRYAISFNGEIYNYLELKNKLKKNGEKFKTKTDTEVLLRLYMRYGDKCLSMLDGMFSFVIWDQKEKMLFCARDRFGEKPFFYVKNRKEFVFASEMKAIFTSGISQETDLNRIVDYLQYNLIVDLEDAESTFYKGVKSLEPSSFMKVYGDGKIKKTKYWSLNNIPYNDISFQDAKDRFRSLFSQSIERRLRSDVTVGSSLSGGLDSSSIVRMIDVLNNGNNKQNTFSARFHNFDKDEGEFIDQITKISRVNAYDVWPNASTFIDNLDRVFYHQEEPFQSTSISAQWCVMELARKNDTIVLLDGQGADEYLIGYHGNGMLVAYFNYLSKGKISNFRNQLESYNKLHGRNLAFPRTYRIRNKFPFLNPILDSINSFRGVSDEKVLMVTNELFRERTLRRYSKMANLREATSFALFNESLPKLLRYSDRNAMAHSVEVRLPFLSHELVEFVYSIEDSYKFDKGWTKLILRESMADLLPENIKWRKDKIGYLAPQKKWLDSPKVNELINDSISFLRKERIIDDKSFNKDVKWKYLMAFMTMNSSLTK